MRQNIIIYGAGAIGRGYLPWVLSEESYDLIFVDTNPQIIENLKKRNSYQTYMVCDGELVRKSVLYKAAYYPEELLKQNLTAVGAVFFSVGPRAIANAANYVCQFKCPFILCENDPATVEQIKTLTGNQRSYFAVPDVITSNSAPDELLQVDPLAVVSESGQLFIDNRACTDLVGKFQTCTEKELSDQWTAKLFLHNTPHCVAAYLGALIGSKYIHEVMKNQKAEKIIRGSMNEMLQALKARWEIPHAFLEWYAEKELQRFACTKLFDPITRVAREPLRKLEPQGRLVGAAQLCLAIGLVPHNVIKGIAAALLFHNEDDADSHLKFLRSALSPSVLVTYILGLRHGEALELLLVEKLELLLNELESLKIESKELRKNE